MLFGWPVPPGHHHTKKKKTIELAMNIRRTQRTYQSLEQYHARKPVAKYTTVQQSQVWDPEFIHAKVQLEGTHRMQLEGTHRMSAVEKGHT